MNRNLSKQRYNLSNHFTTPAANTPAATPSAPGQIQQGYTTYNLVPMKQELPSQPMMNTEFKIPDSVPYNQSDVKMDDVSDTSSVDSSRPAWMKSKLQGVKKVSNKERRRRQNETLRRLLSPKNALMVLNEMAPADSPHNFKVELAPPAHSYQAHSSGFCADLSFEGNTYKGYGENKLSARNAAAEQAIRDIILKRLTKTDMITDQETESESDALPMIQLASFALHKLFSEWEVEGHKVPALKPGNASNSEKAQQAAAPPKKRDLPEGAATMHPCMLLTYMRPRIEYREIATEGEKPQQMMFTIAVDIDGVTYTGRAPNKKEARKAAAAAACQNLFGFTYPSPASIV